MGVDGIQGTSIPFMQAAGQKANKIGQFAYGGWADAYGHSLARELTGELGIERNTKTFKDIFKGDTWKQASKNIKKFKNAGQTSLGSDTLNTIQRHYTKAQRVEAMRAAKAAATKAAKKANPGLLGKMWGGIKKGAGAVCKALKLDKATQTLAKNLLKVPGINKAFGAIGKLGKSCKLPGIGTLLMTIGEVPSVINAFAKGGIGEGLKQIVRSTGELLVSCGAFAIGSAAGTAIAGVVGQVLCPIPGLGFVLGMAIGMGLSYVAEKATKPVLDGVIGKSFAEKQQNKQEEIQAQQQEQKIQIKPQATSISPFEYDNNIAGVQVPKMNTNNTDNFSKSFIDNDPFIKGIMNDDPLKGLC